MSMINGRLSRFVLATLVATWAWAVAVDQVYAAEPGDPVGENQARIEALIEQLGDDDYFVRQQAQTELAAFSFEAFDALDQATTHTDLEIAARARYLLGLLRVQWTNPDDPEVVRILMRDYEQGDMASRLARIQALVTLPQGEGLPVLCRLIRYEQSPVLAKEAAIALLGKWTNEGTPSTKEKNQLREALGSSHRDPAGWVLTWLRLAEEPEATIAEWNALVEAESALLQRFPSQTRRSIVAGLTRIQAEIFQQLGRREDWFEAMDRVVALQDDDPNSLKEMLLWLLEQEAWDQIDALIVRFSSEFAKYPLWLYEVAEVQVEKGEADRAEKTVERTLAMNPGNGVEQRVEHYAAAQSLSQRGLFAWAEAEYRRAIGVGPPTDIIGAEISFDLADMLHDQEKDREAAEALNELIEAVGKQAQLNAVLGSELAVIRSTMHLFLASDAASRNNYAEQREHLDKALEGDSTNPDVLIARYDVPEQPAEFRRETMQLIEKRIDQLLDIIAQIPDEAEAYNEYAWLVANTEGDLDKALQYSKRSIQLKPNNGSLLDTLAHVYFARGDYANAVHTQRKAVELEPHRRQITSKLEVFEKKWEETKGTQ